MKTLKSSEITAPEDLDIQPVFPFYTSNESLKDHLANTKRMLLQLLPKPMPFRNRQGLEKWLHASIPLLEWASCEPPPSILTLSLLSKPLSAIPSETFFQEMIKLVHVPFCYIMVLLSVLKFIHQNISVNSENRQKK